MNHFPPVCVSIGATSPLGGSGVLADTKTFTALGCYGTAAITGVGVEHPPGVQAIEPIGDRVLAAQLDAISATFSVNAVKIGLCPSVSAVNVIAQWLTDKPNMRVVVDPVIADVRGIALATPEVIRALCEKLLPRATVATPNRFEAAVLAGMEECLSLEDMAAAAKHLSARYGCAVVVTGGGLGGRSIDVLAGVDGISHFEGPINPRGKVLGIGCTHAATVTAGLAKGDGLRDALLHAKLYIGAAIQAAPTLPDGRPVIWHGVTVREHVMVER